MAAFELVHPPYLDHGHLPLDHCSPFEVAQLLDLLLHHHFEPYPHLELVEMLVWRKIVDLDEIGDEEAMIPIETLGFLLVRSSYDVFLRIRCKIGRAHV